MIKRQPTKDELRSCAGKYYGQRDREVFNEDIIYFICNWEHSLGMYEAVEQYLDERA